jgi:hypothetical protein
MKSLKKETKKKPFRVNRHYQRLPVFYLLALSTGGWILERTDEMFYLGKPTGRYKIEIIKLGDY